MKKLVAVLAIALLVVSVGSAQDIWGQGKMRAGAGALLSLGMSDWADNVGMGFGGFGKFEYGLNEDMVIQASVGYIIYMEKEVDYGFGVNSKNTASAMPIIGAFKYNLSKIVTPGFYGFAEFGIWSLTQKAEIPAVTSGFFTFPAQTIEASSSESVLGIGAGFDTGMLDISVKYLLKGNFNQIVFGAAYNFGL